jgi:hypothetical protein
MISQEGKMQNKLEKSQSDLKKIKCFSFGLLIFVIIGAGCATPLPPAPEQGQYIKVQLGQNTVSVPWSNTAAQSGQLTVKQIVDWTIQGVSSDEIISRIRAANPRYALTAEDIKYLNKQNVSQRVIETMQSYR